MQSPLSPSNHIGITTELKVFEGAEKHSVACRIITTRVWIVNATMETLEDLVSYQRQLDQEEEFLTKLILQINEQINRLQVEQMELQSSMFENSSPQKEAKPKLQKSPESSTEELILSVPVNIKRGLEEESEEEDEED